MSWLEGYTAIPNELFCREDLNPIDRNILFIILSYQFLENGKEFSENYLTKLIGMKDKRVVRRSLKVLVGKNLIIKVKESDHTKSEGAHYKANCGVKISLAPGRETPHPRAQNALPPGRETLHPGARNAYELNNNKNNNINNTCADKLRPLELVDESLKEEIIESFKEICPDALQSKDAEKKFKSHKKLPKAVKDLPTIEHWRALFTALAQKMDNDSFWSKQGRKTAITYFLQCQKNSNIPQWILWHKDAPKQKNEIDPELQDFLRRNGYVQRD